MHFRENMSEQSVVPGRSQADLDTFSVKCERKTRLVVLARGDRGNLHNPETEKSLYGSSMPNRLRAKILPSSVPSQQPKAAVGEGF